MRILSPYTLKWLSGGDEHNDISALIRESYHQVYNASLARCMTWLLGLYDAHGVLTSACGIQEASEGPLYLEKYLDDPIESTLSARLGITVPRCSIIEVGNFAARDGASARIMYAALCQLLIQYQYAWIVFTGTKKIRNTFHRMSLKPIELMPANPQRLGAESLCWGEYYQHDPRIMAGELAGGHTTLSQTSLLLQLLSELPNAPWAATAGECHVSECP